MLNICVYSFACWRLYGWCMWLCIHALSSTGKQLQWNCWFLPVKSTWEPVENLNKEKIKKETAEEALSKQPQYLWSNSGACDVPFLAKVAGFVLRVWPSVTHRLVRIYMKMVLPCITIWYRKVPIPRSISGVAGTFYRPCRSWNSYGSHGRSWHLEVGRLVTDGDIEILEIRRIWFMDINDEWCRIRLRDLERYCMISNNESVINGLIKDAVDKGIDRGYPITIKVVTCYDGYD